MKFGRTLSQAVQDEPDPASRDAFLSYKLLKKHCSSRQGSSTVRHSEFDQMLCSEVDKFNGWFARQALLLSVDFWRFERAAKCLSLGRLRGRICSGVSPKDKELLARARRLRRFAEMNTIATWKILKKYAKRHGHSALGSISLDGAFHAVLAKSPVVSPSFWSVIDDLCVRANQLDSNQYRGPLVSVIAPSCFNCPICLDMMAQPVVAKQCGHRFCSSCIRAFLSTLAPGRRKCPVCRVSNADTLLVDMHALERFLHHTYPLEWRRRQAETSQNKSERRVAPRSYNAMLLLA